MYAQNKNLHFDLHDCALFLIIHRMHCCCQNNDDDKKCSATAIDAFDQIDFHFVSHRVIVFFARVCVYVL